MPWYFSKGKTYCFVAAFFLSAGWGVSKIFDVNKFHEIFSGTLSRSVVCFTCCVQQNEKFSAHVTSKNIFFLLKHFFKNPPNAAGTIRIGVISARYLVRATRPHYYQILIKSVPGE